MAISGFIVKAACRGYRPRQFSSNANRQRPRLIARLIKQRNAPRFIVAPPGYGKTCLAIDYAETVFAWVHVFWINGQSPCFIRDLDQASIAADCLAIDSDAKLVVVDDLPQLDAERASQFSREIDALLKANCEVIVICSPPSDLMGKLQADRQRIGPMELLLDDEEVDLGRTEDERKRTPSSELPACCRVPALAWGTGTESATAFVRANLSEELPSDVMLACCSAYVLQQGDLQDLFELGPIDKELIRESLADYPHFGFDLDAERFQAPSLPIEAMASQVKARLDSMVERSPFSSRAELVRAWADLLLKSPAQPERACDVMRTLCPFSSRSGWLLSHAHDLAHCGCFYPWLRVIASLRDSRRDERVRLLAAEAICRRMLGDEDGAILCAKRHAFDDNATSEAHVINLIIVAMHAQGQLRQQALSKLEQLAQATNLLQAAPNDLGSDRIPAPSATTPSNGTPSRRDALIVAWHARQMGAGDLTNTWLSLRDAGADDDTLCLAASWLYALLRTEPDGMRPNVPALLQIETHVRERLPRYGEEPTSFFASSAALSLEAAHAEGVAYLLGPFEPSVLIELKRVELDVVMQRRRFETDERVKSPRRGGSAGGIRQEYTRDNPLIPQAPQQSIPTLELRFFGRFDVSIGGIPISADALSRKNTRLLLVMLAIGRGRDLSRDGLIKALWPASDPEVARRNFYTVWSQLRRALMLPNGTCPYLVRHQFGCRLENRYVQSDLARLDDICRELLFGRVDFEQWQAIYTEIDRDFSCELMPTEKLNPRIVSERQRCRSRLVDALIAGALRLTEEGCPEWAIWFARSAITYERTREDAYVALMRAQIANDQRTAAMMTFQECKSVLAEELGIDPSPETVMLYESLLGDL